VFSHVSVSTTADLFPREHVVSDLLHLSALFLSFVIGFIRYCFNLHHHRVVLLIWQRCTLANMSRYSRSNDGSSAGCVEPPVDTLSAGRLLLASLLLFIMLPAVRTVMTRVDTK